MTYFDILYTVRFGRVSSGNPGYYSVKTIWADDESMVGDIVRAHMDYLEETYPGADIRLVGVGPAGTFDDFIGKYVGQFIDEYIGGTCAPLN